MKEFAIVQNRGETQVLEDRSFSSRMIISQCHLQLGLVDDNLRPNKNNKYTLAINRETNDMYIVVTITDNDTRYFVEPDEDVKIAILKLDEEVESGELGITAIDNDDFRLELELKNGKQIHCTVKWGHLYGLF